MDSNEIGVSVIVPVYNAEAFLQKNLVILCGQTLQNIEFVLVDDCSSDRSLKILYAFENFFEGKVKVIPLEKNSGPGGARNVGIKNSRGKYIGFVDQDDIVLDEMYEELYNKAELEDCQIVTCGFYNAQSEKYIPPLKVKGNADINKKIRLCNDSLYIWNKIYLKSLAESMEMPFRLNTTNDDVDFCIEAYLRAERVSYIDKMFYYYSFDGETYSRKNKTNLRGYINRTRELFTSLRKRIKDAGMEQYTEKICENAGCFYLRSYLTAIFSSENFSYDDFKEFNEIAEIILPKYYENKIDGKELRYVLFNMLGENVDESYEKLIRFKEKIKGVE